MSETDSIVAPKSESALDSILRLFADRVESIELSYQVGEVFKRYKLVLREPTEPFDDSPSPLDI